jgi:hypothetical protein
MNAKNWAYEREELGETHMRKIRFWSAIAAAALMLVGTAGWVNSNNRWLEVQASAQIEEARIDPFQIMLNAKNLLSEEFDVLLLDSKP